MLDTEGDQWWAMERYFRSEFTGLLLLRPVAGASGVSPWAQHMVELRAGSGSQHCNTGSGTGNALGRHRCFGIGGGISHFWLLRTVRWSLHRFSPRVRREKSTRCWTFAATLVPVNLSLLRAVALAGVVG